VKASVYRSFAERTFIEKDANVGYDLPHHLFEEWWLTWFWTTKTLDKVGYRVAGLSLHFMATMLEAGDV
jgi:hypothetical protein